eukprot:INCI5113.3.p1 GENE.INCI5113.3~~INCI5113.3.p1  ORF type:complete len:390 (+),score=42.56 INCI5113.3:263-1432(+)
MSGESRPEDGVAAEVRIDDGADASASNAQPLHKPLGLDSQPPLDGNTWAVKAGVERLRRIAEAMDRLHATSGYAAVGMSSNTHGLGNSMRQEHRGEDGVEGAQPGRNDAAGAAEPIGPANKGSGGLEGEDVHELLRQQEENLRIIEEAFKAHVRRYQREKNAPPRTPRAASPDGAEPTSWAGAGTNAPRMDHEYERRPTSTPLSPRMPDSFSPRAPQRGGGWNSPQQPHFAQEPMPSHRQAYRDLYFPPSRGATSDGPVRPSAPSRSRAPMAGYGPRSHAPTTGYGPRQSNFAAPNERRFDGVSHQQRAGPGLMGARDPHMHDSRYHGDAARWFRPQGYSNSGGERFGTTPAPSSGYFATQSGSGAMSGARRYDAAGLGRRVEEVWRNS